MHCITEKQSVQIYILWRNKENGSLFTDSQSWGKPQVEPRRVQNLCEKENSIGQPLRRCLRRWCTGWSVLMLCCLYATHSGSLSPMSIYKHTVSHIEWSIFEPWHEISNNVVCATSKGSDQPAHTRSLIRAFASRLSIICLLSYWLNTFWSF